MNYKTNFKAHLGIWGVFSLFILVFSFSSCKSKQAMVAGKQAASAQQLVQFIEAAQPTFNTMDANNVSIKANLGDRELNLAATLRIKTDSVIVLSATFFGFGLFTLELYPEHWVLFNIAQRTYYTDNYRYLFYKFGVAVNFEDFQSLFSARLFSICEKEVDARKLEFIPLEANENMLKFESRTMKQSTTTHGNHTIKQVLLTNTNETQTLSTTYNDYSETRGINYPRNINIELRNGEQTVIGLDMNIQRVTFNSDLRLSSPNPQRYTRSTIDQLLRQLN